jgi:hypothetical protein
MVGGVQLGSVFGWYRIEAVEREDAAVAVLLARDLHEHRPVALHIAGEPAGALSAVRFLERAQRIGSVDHPNLLAVYDTRTFEGRVVAVAEAPPGRRLDVLLAESRFGSAPAVRIARQLALAVDALEEAGAEPPPLTAERIWVDEAGNAHLDGLDGRIGVALPVASSSASLARLIDELTPHVSAALWTVMTRALDGAYLSAGQLADELGDVEARAAERRRRIALWVVVLATLILLAIVLVAVL